MTIYELMTSQELVLYWETVMEGEGGYLGEELFPNDKKLGLDLKWLKGASGLPVALKLSAYDVAAIPRNRIGMEKLSAEMPFFKESMYIDENQRQELNKVLETGNQAYIDAVMNRIFDDTIQLLRGASVSRERMRMMLLSTGTIVMASNGQSFEYDYAMPEGHKVNATTAWSNPKADVIGDIQKGVKKISEDTGAVVERAICSDKVFGQICNNEAIRLSIRANTNGEGFISKAEVKKFILDNLEVEVITYDKRYKDESGKTQRFLPEDVFVMIPKGSLGKTWFGTTPEESDLMTSGVANVTITDTGVAVTTMKKVDPVNVETKVTQICLPDFPLADQVYIVDTDAV